MEPGGGVFQPTPRLAVWKQPVNRAPGAGAKKWRRAMAIFEELQVAATW